MGGLLLGVLSIFFLGVVSCELDPEFVWHILWHGRPQH